MAKSLAGGGVGGKITGYWDIFKGLLICHRCYIIFLKVFWFQTYYPLYQRFGNVVSTRDI